MPGVYVEYIKAGKFVVPVELTFQTETINAPGDINGFVTTSKWIERHNWKEIKAMLKPAVEACLKYNETPLDNIPKSHHISYGREVSLGYLIIPNKISSSLLSVLDTKKNCWTDDEDDDEDELLGIQDTVRMEDHGSEFTEFVPTKTAIRVCVVRKSVVSIDDARRIRKELGVRSEDVRHYFSSATSHMTNDPGTSSANNLENFDKEKRVSEWAASAMFSHLHDSGSIGLTTQPIQSTCGNLFNSDQQLDRDLEPSNGTSPTRNDPGSDSEVENIPRTFGDPDEIRDAARIYPHVLNRDVDSGEDPDDDLSLPDIEPNPPKRKKGSRTRKKSASLSPSKSKRLTHNNILAISQEGQAAFSEEDATYNKRGAKKSKRKRTVAVVEPMRTLPNGQVSFEHAIGALGSEKRRKARPGSSHGNDKTHSGGGRSKQPPAIDIVAPDDDRLTIKNPPEPLTVASSSTSYFSPFKEAERQLELEQKKMKKKKKRRSVNIDDDPHKYERLTPSPLFSDDDAHLSSDHGGTSHTESDLEMPVLTKMVDSGDERNPVENSENSEENTKNPNGAQSRETVSTGQKDTKASESQQENKPEPEKEITPVLRKEPKEQASPDITQIKVNANLRKTLAQKKSYKRKLKMPSNDEEINRKRESGSSSSKSSPSVSEPRIGTPPTKNTAIPSTSHIVLRSETEEALKQNKGTKKSADESEPEKYATSQRTSPVRTKTPMTSPSVTEKRKTEVMSDDKLNAPREPQKVKRKKRLKNMKKKSIVEDKEKVKVKPKMADGQTQTDELSVVAQIEKSCNTPLISNAIVKVSRSCDVSSEDELYDMVSQRSRRSLLDSPIANLETSHSEIPTIYHPALGSPDTELFDDDGLFSFDSPTIPVISSSQAALETSEDKEDEHLPDADNSSEIEFLEENDNTNIGNENSHEEILPAPTSPQPGCSHWSSTPIARTLTPPPTLSNLMPPPIARPPRTPRKLFGPNVEDNPPRLSLGSRSPESLDVAYDVDETDNECDVMPAGTEAASVSTNCGGGIYNVLNQPGVFMAGLRLMQKVAAKEMSTQEMKKIVNKKEEQSEESKALVPVSPAQRKRDLSPDICDIVPDKRLKLAIAARRSRKESYDESRNNQATSEGQNNAVVLRHVNSDDESSDVEMARNNEQLMEYFSMARSENVSYEPHGDEFDLSQRSYCMVDLFPQYPLKSRLYKIHSKAVRKSSLREVLDHYKKIRSDLFGIYQGTIPSLRHDIFVKGFEAQRDLKNLKVTDPFTGEQANALVTMIYDNFVPDRTKRLENMDYVNFVLAPETFIRIYSRINNISYAMAEVEMRFGANYEGDVSAQYLNLPPPELASLD